MRRLELLGEPAFRRFAVEFLVLALATYALFALVLDAWLLATFPEAFPTGATDWGGYELPETRLGYAQLLAFVVVHGAFLYWRLEHTTLGASLRDALEPYGGHER